MKNLNIGTKLGLGYAIVLALLIAVGVVGLIELKQVNANLHKIVDQESRAIQLVNDLALNAEQKSRLVRSYIVRFGDQEQSRVVRNIESETDSMINRLESLEMVLERLDEREAIDGVSSAVNAFNRGVAAFIENGESGWTSSRLASALDTDVDPLGDELRRELESARSDIEALVREATEEADAIYDFSQTLITSLMVIAVISGIAIAFIIGRGISVPMSEAVEAARAVARGELDGQLRSDRKDEVGRLINALADMRESLKQIVGSIREGVDTINTASSEIAVGNTDLSQRTEEQASSLEETAASMEELTTTVKQNADNARQANSLSKAASENADKGGDVVESVVKRMAEIREGSNKMSEIISVIDGIAFQTNILALNAAVEAARAGEQGRGFAVVATEVRSLAQRSASAAKDIKSLIESSVENISTGSELADKAGTAMDEIVVSIKKVTDIIGEITAASDEQSAGIEQINQAVSEMDQVTQQNAALVEESAAAAESLQSQAEELESSVSKFRLSANDVARKPAGQAKTPKTSAASSNPASKAKTSEKPSTPAKSTGGESDDDWEEF
ncbi:methyl-accepting chemotaxis protein [Marinobacter sp. CHS3-4]|uniref:methyl-accepting chemotaxis protein n=1 Tax=Marinobacter sp. CHS3-4 TaxID=3045174 RepID=UPI0024B634A7|nr:methyl-accepting chemotaxis protein [Marinobacter sp. CHS3-4]MDI9245624.1 methyl-accepting chemotaxis protein [Marinobacter sp. CHS3-4]